MGRRKNERQQEFWGPTRDLASAPRNVFHERFNRLLAGANFDASAQDLCREYYAERGRDSIPPETFLRRLLIGYQSCAGGASDVGDAAGHANVSITSAYLHVAVDEDAVGELFRF